MSIKKLLKQFLGVDDLEKKLSVQNEKINIVESERAELEQKLIESEKTKELIKTASKRISSEHISESLSDAFKELGIDLEAKNRKSTLASIDAAVAVEKYGFKRYSPPVNRAYPKSVISIKEFREHPEEYFHKLKKGVFGFPLNFNFTKLNYGILNTFGNFKIETYNHNYLTFNPETSITRDEKNSLILSEAMNLSNLSRTSDSWINLEPVDFLHNFDGLVNMIKDSDLSFSQREKGVKALYAAKAIFMTSLETVGKSRIRDASELINENGYDKSYLPVKTLTDATRFKEEIRTLLTTDMPGTRNYDVDNLVPIRSIDKFRELASKRTLEIMANDAEKKGLTSIIGKELKDYSIGESVVLSCYFARNVIQKYEKLEDTIKNIFTGNSDDKMSGKCTDYAGISLQYLREYLVPLNPEKFVGWNFGIETTNIGDFNHVYMKIMHENTDGSFDVYFVDPTMLASKGISSLKTPESILKYTNTDSHPLEIIRDAEDFLFDSIQPE